MKIEKSNSEIPKKNNFRINSAPNSESEFKKNSEKNLKNRKNSPQRCTSAQSNKNIEESEKKNRPRVRISSVVENIETRECFRLQTDSVNEFEDTSSESDEKANSPYELTRPYQKDINSNQQKLAPQIPKVTIFKMKMKMIKTNQIIIWQKYIIRSDFDHYFFY